MAKDYPDFQPLDVHEELGPHLPAGPSPSHAMAWTRLLPPSRLALLALVLGLGLSLGSIALSVRRHSLAQRLGQLEHTLARLEAAQGQDRAHQWCRALGARLVVINTPAEQQFVQQHTIPTFTWIGLSDAKGKWEWVDGTPYILDPRDWSPGQPDNWTGHGQGDGEDCVVVTEEGLWNDDRCSRGFPWVCEVTLDPPLASPSPQEAGPDGARSHSPP
ncbi:asialoglycoprotein receptor 1 [Alligator sinensis]|uniref:Asialoglycoprotein receptor 1 n=1 Tax=Alligator sinensis TaxID=38654 RepID=A0A3Q0FUX8_ALLSI|nr:asialoglycoprotein receptor 1 [Alligator sinensis]